MNIASLVGGGVAPALTAVVTAANGGTGAKKAGAPAAAGASPWGTLLDRALGADRASSERRAEQLGALLTRFARGAFTGAATSAGGSAPTSASGSLAFLKDPRLSVEEKLARLMVHLSDKYEKQLEQKLQQYSDLESGRATSSSSSRKSTSSSSLVKSGLSSLLSKAGLSGLLKADGLQKLLGQVAGPVLAGAATALGMPTLAPAILKAGPMVGGLASGTLAAIAGGAGGSSGASGEASSEKRLMTEIQILQEKQKEMFTLVSNILRSQHDTKMAVLSNVR